jgi:endonuclease III
MPSLVTADFNQKNQNKMMIFLDNEECMDDDNVSFSNNSYDAPMVPDSTKIVDIFEPIFQNNLVTVDWVLEQTEEGLRELLRPLGRQANSSKFVIASMTELKKRGGVLPRDYRVLTQFPGVGPKMAIVTCQEVYGNAQGVPHDIHMC